MKSTLSCYWCCSCKSLAAVTVIKAKRTHWLYLPLAIFLTSLTSQTPATTRPMRNILAIWSMPWTELFLGFLLQKPSWLIQKEALERQFEDGLNKQLQTSLNEHHHGTNPSFLDSILIWSKNNLQLLIAQALLAQHHTHLRLQCALWLMQGLESKAQQTSSAEPQASQWPKKAIPSDYSKQAKHTQTSLVEAGHLEKEVEV